MAESGGFVQKRLYSDYFIIKQKWDKSDDVSTCYKAKVGSLTGFEKDEIIHFGQIVADNDEVIIKRKSSDEATHRNDVHTSESLILSAFSRNVLYMVTGLSNRYQLDENRYFQIAMYKGCLSKWDY